MSFSTQDVQQVEQWGVTLMQFTDENISLEFEGVPFTIVFADGMCPILMLPETSVELRNGTLQEVIEQAKRNIATMSTSFSDIYDDEGFRDKAESDVNLAREKYNTQIAFTGIDITVTLRIPIRGLLSSSNAKAMGIDIEYPMEVRMKFTLAYVKQGTTPTFSITQNGNKFPVGQQLTRILQCHLARCWGTEGFKPPVYKVQGPTDVYAHESDPVKCVKYEERRGFVLHIADVIVSRLPSCARYCVLCDLPHVFTFPMVRPCVCIRDVCTFGFFELKLGKDAAETVASQEGTVALLLSIFSSAVFSERAERILDPYPKVVDPHNPSTLAFDPKARNLSFLRDVTRTLPVSFGEVQQQMSDATPLMRSLVDWIVESNRSYLLKLDEQHMLPSMETTYQYLLVTAAPEKQAAFNERKKARGSIFAFHGSRAENWHCILREGLRVKSGTPDQLNGAAHGAGIYFAPSAQTSFQYSGGKITGCTASCDDMICVALCEIVDDAFSDKGWCYTVTDESAVLTRFFFVYPRGTTTSQRMLSANSRNPAFMKEISTAMRIE